MHVQRLVKMHNPCEVCKEAEKQGLADNALGVAVLVKEARLTQVIKVNLHIPAGVRESPESSSILAWNRT
jgi:hypothetical protein